MEPDQGSKIAERASLCLDVFRRLLRRQQEDDRYFLENHIPEDAIEDALARFRTWVENIGALQRGKASLDDRLGHADIRAEVLRLLSQLLLGLDDLWQILSGNRIQQTWTLSDDLSSLEFSGDEESSNEDNDSDEMQTPSSSGESTRPTTESELLYQSISEAITSLLKLSMFIRRSTRGKKFSKSSTAQKYETQYDIIHVRDRYPHAADNPILIERLGKANAQRRQWLSYKKRHREKLAFPAYKYTETQDFPKSPPSASEVDLQQQGVAEKEEMSSSAQTGDRKAMSTLLSSTKASTLYQRNEQDSAATEPDLSETSYSVSRFGDVGQETNLIPRPPPESAGERPFECPYCFSIVTVTSSHSWTQHVHSDLASYVCTQDHCSHPLFESRNQWFNHELEEHRQQWVCNICDNPSPSMKLFEEHMNLQHAGTFLQSQLSALIARSARPLQRILASSCPLCDYEGVVRRRTDLDASTKPVTVKIQTFRNHLGRHLEQLALFVLPKQEVAEQDNNTVRSDAAYEGEAMPSGPTADSDDSEATGREHENDGKSPLYPDKEGKQLTVQMMLGSEATGLMTDGAATLLEETGSKDVLGMGALAEDLDSTPDLAFIWMPPMNFTPPEEDFGTDDDELVPRREDSMFGGDIFTPGWVRGYGKKKEGFCGRCNPGVWHNIDDSSYERNLTYMHGIASTGLSLPRPSSLRQVDGLPGAWQGYCEECRGWRRLKRSAVGWNWFRHWVKEHSSPLTEQGPQLLHPSSATTTGREAKELMRLNRNIRTNDFLAFQSILSRHPKLATRSDRLGRFPLHHAAEVGEISFMEYLLHEFRLQRNNPDDRSFVNAKSAKGETALMLAASQGHLEAAEWLIGNHADINATAANGSTALDDAAEAGYSQLAELMVTHKASIDLSKVYQQIRLRNILMARRRESSESNILKSCGVENSIGIEDLTFLHKAASQGDVLAVKTALVHGMDIEEFSQDGLTPLMLAASNGHHEALQALLASGANIDATSAKGWTTLMNAVRNQDVRTVALLISNGADVNHLSPDRWTALAEAAYQGQKEIMGLLLNCGADTESRSSHDWTPLMHASYKGDEAAVKLLLDAGAETEVTSGHDETALLLAAAGGYDRIALMLLDAGCSPEPQWAKVRVDKGSGANPEAGKDAIGLPENRAHALGWTPLMLASQGGHKEIAHMLLDLRVNVEVKSPHGKTALEIAQENGRLAMVELLSGNCEGVKQRSTKVI